MLSLFHIDKIGEREIICFGAGNHGQNFIWNWNVSFMEYNILYFADNNSEKWGKKLFGREGEYYQDGINIISTEYLKKVCSQNSNILIVITTERYREIYDQLINEGICNDIISEVEFVSIMMGEFMEKYLHPFAEETGYDIIRIYQHCHGWGFVDGRTTAYLRCFLEYYFKGKKLCVLLSPPKTGNTTIVETAKRYGITIHCNHVLAGYYMFENALCRDFFSNFVPKIIIGVRDPIAQYISLLFSFSDYGLAPMCITEWKDAQKIFNKVFIQHKGNDYLQPSAHNENAKKNGIDMGYENLFVDQFMDGQIKQWLGIDLYSYEFDKTRGYSVFEREVKDGKKQQILFYKLEKMNKLENVFKDFLELEEFEFVKSNIGSKKYYSDKYELFKENFKISKEIVDTLYNSKYMRFCYNEDEIEQFRLKWSNNIV